MRTFLSRRKGQSVKFEPWDNEPTDAEFYHEFNKYNESSLWICFMYFITCFVLFSLELDDTILDIAAHKEESCVYGALRSIPWKQNETISIFYPFLRLPCMMYNYNITKFGNMTYKDAKKFVDRNPKPDIIYCSEPLFDRFRWDKSFVGTCRGALYKKYLRGAKMLGMAKGSIILGTLADLFGRKIAITISFGLYFSAALLQPLMDNFLVVYILTDIKGMGKVGLDVIILILFLEFCSKNNRAILVLFTKLLCPIGTIMGIYMKMQLNGFCPELRYIIGIPSLMFFFYIWYVPESPRWSLSYCRKREAWNFLYSLGTPINHLTIMDNLKLNKWQVLKENMKNIFTNPKFIRTIIVSTGLLQLVACLEYAKQEYISVRDTLIPYAHHTLLTMAKMISFMNVLPPLIIFRRRMALLWIFFITTLQLSVHLCVELDVFYILNILMLLSIYSARGVLILYIWEVFPTCMRATSYGIINSAATFLQFTVYYIEMKTASISLPLKNILFFSCSSLAMVAVYFLPEVKNEELPDYKRYRRDYEEKNTTE